jgi:hypothetical protein
MNTWNRIRILGNSNLENLLFLYNKTIRKSSWVLIGHWFWVLVWVVSELIANSEKLLQNKK